MLSDPFLFVISLFLHSYSFISISIHTYMKYDRLIVEVLIEAGSDGLSVAKISRHVYNAVNGLFDEADFSTIHKLVRAFLQRHSHGTSPALCRPKRGVYALNRRTIAGKQLIEQALGLECKPVLSPSSADEPSLPFPDFDGFPV